MNLHSRDRTKAALGELESTLYDWAQKWASDPIEGDVLLLVLDRLEDVKTAADLIRQEHL